MSAARAERSAQPMIPEPGSGERVARVVAVRAAHSGTASSSTRCRRWARSERAGTMSTSLPSSAARSRSSRASVIMLTVGSRSTSRSISESSVSCPLTTLPNTLTFVAPRRAAVSSTSCRRRNRVRPRGVRGRKLDAVTAMTRSYEAGRPCSMPPVSPASTVQFADVCRAAQSSRPGTFQGQANLSALPLQELR